MKAEVVLTPAESKKLIADAVLSMPAVKEALKSGVLAVHPSSSTVFIYEALEGKEPEGLWVCGVIADEGLCGSMEAVKMIKGRGPGRHDPREVSKETWVWERGVLKTGLPLGEVLDRLGEADVYVKGCNALDPEGHAAVLFSNPAGGGGTIGKVMAAKRQQHFQVILPVGLEKLIPVSVETASRAVAFQKTDMAMGIQAALIPVSGETVTECDAVRLLDGVKATPISAGGLGRGGAVVLVLEGEEEPLKSCFDYLLSIKGSRLPELHLPPCEGPVYPMLSLSDKA